MPRHPIESIGTGKDHPAYADVSKDGGKNRGTAAILRASMEDIRQQTEVAAAFLRGDSYKDIAARLGVDTSTVGRIVHRAIEEWKADRNLATSEFALAELERLNLVASESWAAFEKSKGPGGNKPGDAKWMAVIVNIHDRIVRLMNIGGGGAEPVDQDKLNEERERRWAQLKGSSVGNMLEGKGDDPFRDPSEDDVPEDRADQHDGAESPITEGEFRELNEAAGPAETPPTVTAPTVRPKPAKPADQGIAETSSSVVTDLAGTGRDRSSWFRDGDDEPRGGMGPMQRAAMGRR